MNLGNDSVNTTAPPPRFTGTSSIIHDITSHNFAIWGVSWWPLLVLFVLFATFGVAINFISFLHYKQQSGLGNRFQATLNLVDFLACLYFICVAIIGFSYHVEDVPTESILDIIGKEFYTLLILISGLVTVYLSVIRAILTTQPFYKIKQRAVCASFLGTSILFLCVIIVDAVLIEVPTNQLIEDEDISTILQLQLPAVLLEVIPSALLMLILTVSSILTWRTLSSNQLSNHSHAATTTLIISTVYVVLIGTIVTARAFIRLNPANYTGKKAYNNHLGDLGKVSIVKLANSVLNPLIFVTRSRNRWVWIAGLVTKLRGRNVPTRAAVVTSTTNASDNHGNIPMIDTDHHDD
eukprot:sb/3466210/